MTRMKKKDNPSPSLPDDWNDIGNQTPPDTPQPPRHTPCDRVEPIPNPTPKVIEGAVAPHSREATPADARGTKKPDGVSRKKSCNAIGQGYAKLTGAQIQHAENCASAISSGFARAQQRDAIDGALSGDSEFLISLGFTKGG
jgi:hypothetical protein